MSNNRIAGLLQVQVNGVIMDARGEFSYNLGLVKRDEVVGQDGLHGFKETAQPAFIEGSITDRGTLDVKAIVSATNVSVTVQLANGKTIILPNAWYAGEGTVNAAEGELPVRWVGKSAEEV